MIHFSSGRIEKVLSFCTFTPDLSFQVQLKVNKGFIILYKKKKKLKGERKKLRVQHLMHGWPDCFGFVPQLKMIQRVKCQQKMGVLCPVSTSCLVRIIKLNYFNVGYFRPSVWSVILYHSCVKLESKLIDTITPFFYCNAGLRDFVSPLINYKLLQIARWAAGGCIQMSNSLYTSIS